jgi:glycerol kinase
VSGGEPLYLVIDQGGHASRAHVFDASGREHAAATETIATERTGRDRVEHDADELLGSVRRAIAAAVSALGPARRRVRAAGLATQRSSLVCWDRRTGRALSRVISWQDRRAATWLAQFEPQHGRVHELTGLVLSPHYGASKLRWCLDHLEPVQRAGDAGRLVCGPLASFLLFRLASGQPLHADPCNASRTLLWGLAERDWCDELLGLFGIARDLLPRCGPNSGEFGALDADGMRVPITVCTGDQPAALFAFGVPDERVASINAGTGAFIQCVTGARPIRSPGLLTSLAWVDASRERYVLEGSVNGAGSALAWAADELGLNPDAAPARLDEWSGSQPNPPLFLNGVSGLGAPYWVSDFPSDFVGDGTPEAKMVAVLESIAFLLRRNLDAMSERGIAPATLRLTGGLAASEHFSRTLADLCALPLERPLAIEATARGLAYLVAGEPERWTVDATESRRLLPRDDPAIRERYARWLEAMHAALERRARKRV